jgi:1-acyl-sn-glycerol-3-phosphate acyltransferase
LALMTGAPIVPVAMVGAHEIVDRHRILLRLLRNLALRPKVAVEVGDSIDVRALVDGDEFPSPDAVRMAADHVMGELVDLVAVLRGAEPDARHGVDVA